MSESAHGPSPAASVILELTDTIGALIIDATADLLGTEIEISRAGSTTRTHSMVRERLTQPNPQYSAVYPSLEAGEYTIWHQESAPATITIHAGRVTRFTCATPADIDGANGLW